MNAFGLAPLLLIFPATGFLFNALVGRRFVDSDRSVGEKWTGWLASAMAISAFIIGVLLAFSVAGNHFEGETVVLLDWIVVPASDFLVQWAMQIDSLAVVMILVVTGVGSLIHIYAIGYMHGDPDFSRFFAYLNLFLFFMLILVTANNYLMLFVGWEGVGLCSFLLIGFWFDRVNEKGEWMNANAARKAFVVNRVGDFGMILAMILLFWTFGSLEFNTIFESAFELFVSGHEVNVLGMEMSVGAVLTIVTALFLLGAAGKSAQIPLYIWLPDAMAGPTPVSALIHAATMVTAGVYLLVRSGLLVEIARVSGETLFGGVTSAELIAYTGAFTAVVAGLIAFTQYDIKKVLAYSTVSQLGFMIAAAGMGAYVAAMFHLVAHAFFKGLLFLSSGSVIHGMEHGHHHLHEDGHHDEEDGFDPQDMRTMGGLRHKMKITFWVYMLGALALAGVFPLAGFWSKDEILAHGFNNPGTDFTLVYVLLTIAAFCTAFYMGRQLLMVFFGKPRHEAAEHAVESAPLMTVPLIILALLSVFAGVLNFPFLSEASAHRAEELHELGYNLLVEQWLEHSLPIFELEKELEELAGINVPDTPLSLTYLVAGLSTLLALSGLFFAWLIYRKKPETAQDPDPLERTPIWWMAVLPLNTLYMKGLVPAYNWLARFLAEKVDWAFWHDWFHDRVIRDGFVGLSGWLSAKFDLRFIDGWLVNGSGQATRWLANQLRLTQTGYVRNYALAVFLGVVALLAYFLFVAL
jgi:NADH-quinone oxidoreductase subunit L